MPDGRPIPGWTTGDRLREPDVRGLSYAFGPGGLPRRTGKFARAQLSTDVLDQSRFLLTSAAGSGNPGIAI